MQNYSVFSSVLLRLCSVFLKTVNRNRECVLWQMGCRLRRRIVTDAVSKSAPGEYSSTVNVNENVSLFLANVAITTNRLNWVVLQLICFQKCLVLASTGLFTCREFAVSSSKTMQKCRCGFVNKECVLLTLRMFTSGTKGMHSLFIEPQRPFCIVLLEFKNQK